MSDFDNRGAGGRAPFRIAFYSPRASHLRPGESGDQVFVRTLLADLRGRRHQIEIVSRVNVRNVWRGRVSALHLVGEAMAVRREMKRFSPDAWLIYNTSVTNPDLFGWWQRPKRYVLLNADVGERKRLPRRWRWLFMFAHRRSLARADKVIAERPKSADRLRAFGIPKERLCVLPPAVRTWDWMPSREESRRRLTLPQEAPVILCVSRLSVHTDRPGKTDMILHLLAALAPLSSDLVLVLVGDGPGRRRVEEQVAKLKLERRVRLVGSVPHDEIRWFYVACDFYAYPDLMDRMFNTILEAQACGRPVVTMQSRSAEFIVDAGRTGLLAKDMEEFQAHMAALARDKARCESMGDAAREYIAKLHSMETRIRQIEDLLLAGS